MKRWLAAVALGLSLAGVAHAAIDTYEFSNDAERERFRELTKELRCPKCQNQDIADSNAPICCRPAPGDFSHAWRRQGQSADHRLHGRPLW